MTRNDTTRRRWALATLLLPLAILLWAAVPRQSGTAAPASVPELSPTASVTPAQTIDISRATPVACGQAIAGTTAGAANNVSTYGCVPWWPETGPEQVFALTLNAGVRVDVLLNDLADDLDLFLLTGASAASCVAYGDNALSMDPLAPGVYYLVVDGFDGAAGPFQLDVWCPLAVTPSPTPTATPTATPRPPLLRTYLPLLLADDTTTIR